jgi:hypothetical protein
MTILWNFLLMVTWVPAWMVVHYNIMSMKESSNHRAELGRIYMILNGIQ